MEKETGSEAERNIFMNCSIEKVLELVFVHKISLRQGIEEEKRTKPQGIPEGR